MAYKHSFRFVCQGGGLDYKAVFLAASLAINLRCPYELIACIPQYSKLKPPDENILKFLHQLGVILQPIENPICEDYLIGHKLACLDLETKSDIRIFIDSDMLCLKLFHEFPGSINSDLRAKLEDWNHHSDNEWTKVYDFLNLGPPNKNFRSTVFGEPMPLYFNAGLLVVNNQSSLPKEWIKTAVRIEKHLKIPRKRPNLDQLSLAGLVIKNEYSFDLFNEDYNYPNGLRPLDHSRIPFFCHYHDKHAILADSFLSATIRKLCYHFKDLREIIDKASDEIWREAANCGSEKIYL